MSCVIYANHPQKRACNMKTHAVLTVDRMRFSTWILVMLLMKILSGDK